MLAAKVAQIQMTPAGSAQLVEVAFRRPRVKLMVNALGTPRDLVERAQLWHQGRFHGNPSDC